MYGLLGAFLLSIIQVGYAVKPRGDLIVLPGRFCHGSLLEPWYAMTIVFGYASSMSSAAESPHGHHWHQVPVTNSRRTLLGSAFDVPINKNISITHKAVILVFMII